MTLDEILNNTPKVYAVASVEEKYLLKYNIGDSVYLKTCTDQYERIVTAILIRQSGIMYSLSQACNESYHYDFEISKDRNILKVTTS